MLKGAKDGNAKTLPEGLVQAFPKLAGLIMKMLSQNPAKRPSIIELMNDPIFCHSLGEIEVKRKLSGGSLEGELLVKKGNGETWKIRYLKLSGENLYVYKKRGDHKARIWYSLKDCLVNAERAVPKLKTSGGGTGDVIATIENENIETLYLKLRNEDKKYGNWLELLNLSGKPHYSTSNTNPRVTSL